MYIQYWLMKMEHAMLPHTQSTILHESILYDYQIVASYMSKHVDFKLPHLHLAPHLNFAKIFNIRKLVSLGYHVSLFA